MLPKALVQFGIRWNPALGRISGQLHVSLEPWRGATGYDVLKLSYSRKLGGSFILGSPSRTIVLASSQIYKHGHKLRKQHPVRWPCGGQATGLGFMTGGLEAGSPAFASLSWNHLRWDGPQLAGRVDQLGLGKDKTA